MKRLPKLADLMPSAEPRARPGPQTADEIELNMRRWRVVMAFAEAQPPRSRR